MLKKILFFAGVLGCFWGHFAQAELLRVGLAPYEVMSGEKAGYLQKIIQESLSISLKEKENFSVILSQKNRSFDVWVTGSVFKVGAPIQINTRVLTAGAQEPILLTLTTDPDRLLTDLKKHGQEIAKIIHEKLAISSKVEPPKKGEPIQTPPLKSELSKQVPSEPKKVKKEEDPSIRHHALEKNGKLVSDAVTNPDYQWMSERLPFAARGMVYADLDADGKNELVLIDLHHVYIYELSKEGLRRLAHYEVSASDHLVHASVFDLEGDGKNEILVSSLRNAEASSFGFRYDHGELKPVLKDSPWLLQTISSGGKTILIGEPYLGREISSHHIKKLKWTGSALKEEEKFVAPSEVGVYGLSRFDSGLVFLSQSGSLKFYESDGKEGYRKSWSSSESYGGTSNFVNFEVRGILNEVESRRTYINLDPVTGVDEQGRGTVVVAKNDSFLKNVIGTLPMVKNAWLVKLKMEEVGLREVVNTRKIDGYLADVQRVDLPWEKGSKILTLIWLRDKGFASSVGTFQSVVAVYDL